DEPEVFGLLALCLLHDSRRDTRQDGGRIVLLDEQDRRRWDHAQIAEGIAVLERALSRRRAGPYQLQAAIVAVHAEAATAADTDWRQIALLYRRLVEVQPSPVIELNRAVAVAMAEGAAAGLELMAPLAAVLDGYQPFHAARADLLRRLGRRDEATAAYVRGIADGGSELCAKEQSEERFTGLRCQLRHLVGRFLALHRPFEPFFGRDRFSFPVELAHDRAREELLGLHWMRGRVRHDLRDAGALDVGREHEKALQNVVRQRHHLAVLIVGRIAHADVVAGRLRHPGFAIEPDEDWQGDGHVWLLAGVLLDFAAGHEVEELLGAADLHVAFEREGVVALHERVQEFVQVDRLASIEP